MSVWSKIPWGTILTAGIPWVAKKVYRKVAGKKAKKVVSTVCDALEGKHGDDTQKLIAETITRALAASREMGLDKQAEAARERGRKP
jgi:hypothetical protein